MLDNNIVTLIGARGQSKRIPNKNIKYLGKHPLVAYSIMTGMQLKYPVYVSSDSSLILDIAKSYGANTILRPKEYATDDSLDIEWLTHAIKEIENEENKTIATIILLRPTTPIRDILIVKKAISIFDKRATSLRSVEPLKEAIEKSLTIKNGYLIPSYPFEWLPISPYFENELKEKYKTDDLTILPNQVYTTSYMANGYIDILRTKILFSKSLYGDKVQAFATERTIDIDTIEDFKLAELLIKEKYDKYKI